MGAKKGRSWVTLILLAVAGLVSILVLFVVCFSQFSDPKAHPLITESSNIVVNRQPVSLITEDQYKDRLESLTNGELTNEEQQDKEDIDVMVMEQVGTKVTPFFGVFLVSIALIYVVVLGYQIFWFRSRRRRSGDYDSSFEEEDEEYYSDLSRSQSQIYDSAPNTISYMDSQLYTPSQSIYNSGQQRNYPPITQYSDTSSNDAKERLLF